MVIHNLISFPKNTFCFQCSLNLFKSILSGLEIKDDPDFEAKLQPYLVELKTRTVSKTVLMKFVREQYGDGHIVEDIWRTLRDKANRTFKKVGTF